MIAVILVLTGAFVAASASYAGNRETPVYQPPPEAPASASASEPAQPTPRTPVLAFYGDNYVSGTAEGGEGAAGWPAIVSQRVGAEPRPVHAVAGAGYVAAAPTTGDTYVTLAQNAPEPSADVTVVLGSRNDYLATPEAIYAAATTMFGSIRTAAPNTRLLIIGPVWTDAAVPAEIPPVRDAVARAAAAAGATFVDPLTERWFFGTPQLIGADVVNPTDEGHAYLADRIEPILRQVLAAAPGPSAATATSGS